MEKILYDESFFKKLIKNNDKYFAHLPKDIKDKSPELLSEHSSLTFTYLCKIVKGQFLEECISKMIESSIPPCISNRQYAHMEILNFFKEAVAFHDLGKLNVEFQHLIMKNDLNDSSALCNHRYGSQHSVLSMYLYLAMSLYRIYKNEDQEMQMFLYGIAVYFSYNIVKHHSSMLLETQIDVVWNDDRLKELSPYLNLLNGYSFTDNFIQNFHSILKGTSLVSNGVFDQMNAYFMKNINPFSLYALMRLHYSLLTSSDYLATAHYMNNWKNITLDFGIITDELRKRIVQNVSAYKYNFSIYKSMQSMDVPQIRELTKKSNDNLNLLRKSIAIEVIDRVRQNMDKNLFYIEAPTGGGKTNLSILAAIELLRNKNINKIFYVFPFTTLITQTYVTLKQMLGLNDHEIIELHSKSIRFSDNADGKDNEYISYIDEFFVNYPITLLSHVKFFSYLTTNRKEANYVFSRLANSIIVLDEIQSYNPITWDTVAYFIKEYAFYFNIKFIIMSATLPKIGNIIQNADFTYLVSNKNDYFLNPNFCQRVEFDYTLLSLPVPKSQSEHEEYLSRLHDILLAQSKKYSNENIFNLGSVYTIIEFIYKRSASEFYTLFLNDDFFDEVFLLSGTILEPRRREIISKLKSGEYRTKKILLISTQVVEAGVDIDMDLGFKDKSIIDSEEQLAGRINRNINKRNSKLFIFNCDSAGNIYGYDQRYKLMKTLSFDEYKYILESKDFDFLYNKVLERIINQNKSNYIENIHTLEKYMSALNYKQVSDSLVLINGNTLTVYVPLKLKTTYFDGYLSILNELNIKYDEFVDGKEVWKIFENLIINQGEDYVRFKYLMKRLYGVMSFFSFSVYPEGKDFEMLQTYGEEKFGYFYLESYHNVYSFESGISTSIFTESMFF